MAGIKALIFVCILGPLFPLMVFGEQSRVTVFAELDPALSPNTSCDQSAHEVTELLMERLNDGSTGDPPADLRVKHSVDYAGKAYRRAYRPRRCRIDLHLKSERYALETEHIETTVWVSNSKAAAKTIAQLSQKHEQLQQRNGYVTIFGLAEPYLVKSIWWKVYIDALFLQTHKN